MVLTDRPPAKSKLSITLLATSCSCSSDSSLGKAPRRSFLMASLYWSRKYSRVSCTPPAKMAAGSTTVASADCWNARNFTMSSVDNVMSRWILCNNCKAQEAKPSPVLSVTRSAMYSSRLSSIISALQCLPSAAQPSNPSNMGRNQRCCSTAAPRPMVLRSRSQRPLLRRKYPSSLPRVMLPSFCSFGTSWRRSTTACQESSLCVLRPG
mmetsp:Transcript_63790/g.148600  ORF Transcript_63790/g.148600 Transcript_63790/m.148600 type:complete len:209 (-) Transcript_63790:298-924(-)